MKDLIDIRLVLTQVLGFLLLVWVLGRFAWGPIVAQLEERRRRIAEAFEEAERRKAAADALKAKYEQEMRAIDVQAREKLQAAVAEGQKVAAEIKHQAHADANARIQRAEEEIVREAEKSKEVLKERIAGLSIRAAEKILRAELDEARQRKLVQAFLDEVGTKS